MSHCLNCNDFITEIANSVYRMKSSQESVYRTKSSHKVVTFWHEKASAHLSIVERLGRGTVTKKDTKASDGDV